MVLHELIDCMNPLGFVRVYRSEDEFGGDPLFEGLVTYCPNGHDTYVVESLHALYDGVIEIAVECDGEA